MLLDNCFKLLDRSRQFFSYIKDEWYMRIFLKICSCQIEKDKKKVNFINENKN